MNERTILIVEDDPDLRPLLEFTFENEGYDTVSFGDGSDAWEYLETTEAPDCLVLDLMMPGLDGMGILRRRANDDTLGSVPAIVLTASESERSVEEAFDRGADDYITKPFSPKELLVRTRRLLRRNG